MELLLLKLSELGIKTVFKTDFNTPTSCFRTQIAFTKNDGEWNIKPLFHKGHAAPEAEIKSKLSEFLTKIGKLKGITVATKGNDVVGLPGKRVEECPECRSYCFSIQDNFCLSCGHERKHAWHMDSHQEFCRTLPNCRHGKSFVPCGDIYTPDQFPERHNL